MAGKQNPRAKPSRGPVKRSDPKAGRSKLVLLGLAGAVLAVVVVGVVLASDRSDEPATIAASGDLKEVPALEGTDPITGERVALADFAGKPVVVNLWADWCPGCRAEAPALRQLALENPDAVVLGIDVRDTESAARRFYAEFDWSHPSIFDPDGRLANELGLIGMPTTIFLNAQHQEVTRIVGETSLAGFEGGLQAARDAS